MQRIVIICILLTSTSLWVYWPVRHHDFLLYDDPEFVTENPTVQARLSWKSAERALTSKVVGNWHPLTTLSHLLDVQLFGNNAGLHHLMNAAIHAANALLLFLLLRHMTQTLWRSAFVAAVFALHPLRVESVAWIAERKDLLCGFFMFLTVWSYARYAKTRAPAPPNAFPRSCAYWMAVLLFAFGLMSKPMLVTLPLILLLVDFWPLGRLQTSCEGRERLRSIGQLVTEKWPFFALAGAFSIITVLTQSTGGAMRLSAAIDLWTRLDNALVSYLRYILKFFWPANLAVIYPHPALVEGHSGFSLLGVAALFSLLAISILSIKVRWKQPAIGTGWFWYLTMMLPVIGIIQVGEQAMADRYSYLPMIGLTIALAWGFPGICRFPRWMLSLAAALALGILALLSRQQLAHWRNTVTLFSQAATAHPNNPTAEFFWGAGLWQAGEQQSAKSHFERSTKLNPSYEYNVAQFYAQNGRWLEAREHYETLLRNYPRHVPALTDLAGVMQALRDHRAAKSLYAQVLGLASDSANILNNFSWLLATSWDTDVRNGEEAVHLAESACRLTNYREPMMVGTLAAAYAEAGQFSKAVASAELAAKLATDAGNTELAQRNHELLELYQSGSPFHEAPPVSPKND